MSVSQSICLNIFGESRNGETSSLIQVPKVSGESNIWTKSHLLLSPDFIFMFTSALCHKPYDSMDNIPCAIYIQPIVMSVTCSFYQP